MKTITYNPETHVLVPREPSEEMLQAALRANMQHVIDCINDPAKSKDIGSEETCKRTYRSRYASMIAASPQPADDELRQWISVDDRLPGEQGNDSEEVLCFLNGHCNLTDMECRCGGGWGIRLGYYDAEKGMFRVFGRPNQFVTHWMPLPKPPAIDAAISKGEQK